MVGFLGSKYHECVCDACGQMWQRAKVNGRRQGRRQGRRRETKVVGREREGEGLLVDFACVYCVRRGTEAVNNVYIRMCSFIHFSVRRVRG